MLTAKYGENRHFVKLIKSLDNITGDDLHLWYYFVMQKVISLFKDKLFVARSIFYFLLFILLFVLFKNGCLNTDDVACCGFFPVTLGKSFWYYGSWVVPLNNFLLYWLPFTFKINLQDWSGVVGGLFETIVTLGMILAVEKNGYLNKISPKIVIPVTFIIFVYSFQVIYMLKPPDYFIFCAFFRFVFPPLLFMIFLYNLYKILREQDVCYQVFVPITFLMASSSEVLAGISLVTVSLTILAILIEGILTKNLNKKSLLITLGVFLVLVGGTLFLVTNEGFRMHYLHKSAGQVFSWTAIFMSLPEFWKDYSAKVLINYLPIYLSLLFLMGVNFWALPDRKKFVPTFFPSFVYVGILIFMFMLIFAGKHHYSGGYWTSHRDIHLLIILLFIYSLSFSIFEFLKRVKFEDIKKLLVVLCVGSTFVLCVLSHGFYNQKLNLKKFTYLNDKIRLFYEYKDMSPALPPTTMFECVFYVTHSVPIDIYEYNEKIDDNSLDPLIMHVLEDYAMGEIYFVNVKNRFNDVRHIGSVPESLRLVEALGGNFDEFKTNDFKFAKLSDKKFVLGEK